MTAAATISAFGRWTAAAARGCAPMSAKKAVDDTRSSVTTLANDDTLWLPLEANSEYDFDGLLTAAGAAIGTGDIKITLTWPAGSNAQWAAYGFSTGSTTPAITHAENTSGGAHSFGVDGANLSPVRISGSITTGSTAGALRVQWSQNSSNATGTTLKAGSKLRGWQTG